MAFFVPAITGCGGHAGPCTADEEWDVIVDLGTGSGYWRFCLKIDSTITVNGEWIYDMDLGTRIEEVRCPFGDGLATILGTAVSFAASGTAAFTSDPFETSPFTLQVDGTASGGLADGTYTITFTGPGWPAQLTGT